MIDIEGFKFSEWPDDKTWDRGDLFKDRPDTL